ncbi:MAG: T9SS type A sorting domain-containing protein [Bacteroidota bacterium]
MKTSLLPFLLFASLFFCQFSFAQCDLIFTADDGSYSVSVTLLPTNVVPNNVTVNGYNYNVDIDYTIVFSGSNPPSNLFTLQGNLNCDNAAPSFFNLPVTPGTGTITTVGNAFVDDTNSATVTPEDLGCTTAVVDIEGTNLPAQMGDCSSFLPVDLLYFRGSTQGGAVLLEWATAQEINNEFFRVEQSTDGRRWSAVGRLIGAGNSSEMQRYRFRTSPNTTGSVFYRLKQFDFDGQHSVSDVIQLNFNRKPAPAVFPNPTSGLLTITNEVEAANEAWIVFSTLGVDVTNQVRFEAKVDGRTTLNFSALPTGVYLLSSESASIRIMKQ